MFNWLKKRVSPHENAQVLESAAAIVSPDSTTGNADAIGESVRCKERGNELLAEGQLSDAAACYRQAVALNPKYAEGLLNLGFVLREQRLFADAEDCLSQATRLNPAMPDAFYVLGTVMEERRNLPGAIECFGKALALKPDFDDATRDLCRVLINTAQVETATHVLLQAIAVNPGNAGFHCTLGDLYESGGSPDAAIACYAKAVAARPDLAAAHVGMGRALQARGDLDEAVKCYGRAIAINANDAGTHNNLGAALIEQGKLDEGVISLRSALALDPNLALASNNLAVLLQAQGRGEEAASFYREALSINPSFSEAHGNLGTLLMEQGKSGEAVACYQKALSVDPSYVEAHSNLGIAFKQQGRLAEAEASLTTALTLDPRHASAHQNLAVVLHAMGNVERVLPCYRRALELKPDNGAIKMYYAHQAQHECEWADIESHSLAIRQAVRDGTAATDNPISPFSFLAVPGSTALEQKLCAEKWAWYKCRHATSLRGTMGFDFKREPGATLHIGYLSADLREHPVAHLMAQVFELHNRERFRISAYSYGPDDGSAMRRRLAKGVDEFVDIRNASDEGAARKIHADDIDILVDLTGFTANARTSILAFRPAPIQVNYLGYPGTMGAEFIDYLIADRFVVPAGQRHCYVETVAWLPDCFLPNDRTLSRLSVPSRKECGLPEGDIVFCCFNQPYKITPEIFHVWCRLLAALPKSTLWLKAGMPSATNNLKREAHRRGVDPARLVMASQVANEQQHLARLQCADLFLDTIPYNAHTTCSDALWMGLPVITCVGETFPSRVAGSLLTALNVPELIAYSLDEYYELALNLATDQAKRENIRRRIRANCDSAPAFDSTRFTHNLETLYADLCAAAFR